MTKVQGFAAAVLTFCWLLAAASLPARALGESPATLQDPGAIAPLGSSTDELHTALPGAPQIPASDEDVLALAQHLFSVEAREPTGDTKEAGGCRTPDLERLFAALRNPALSDETRILVERLMADSMPALPKTLTYGHFKLHYTDSNANPDHNVTRAEVKATAVALQDQWNRYAANLKKPLHYDAGGREWIDINIFFWGDAHFGETSSAWDFINLSSKNTVKDPCRRKTVTAHELFHRVFFNYGLDSAAIGDWMVEGMAVWAQKYCTPNLLSYISEMNFGLLFPDRDFLAVRGYDASHFWIYLDKRAGWSAIGDILAACEANGQDVFSAMDLVLTERLKMNFEQFLFTWIRANYLKDMNNAGIYDYTEDELRQQNCDSWYGPLSHVKRTSAALAVNNTSLSFAESVHPYGADYYEFTLAPTVTRLKLQIVGESSGDFFYQLIGMKANRWLKILQSGKPSSAFSLTLAAGQWDKACLIVSGGSRGGTYTIKAGP